MAQKQDEALDKSDLHQNVSQPDCDEVKKPNWPRLLASLPLGQGKNQKHQHRQERDGQDHAQNGHTQIIFPVDALHQRFGMQDLPELQGEKEKRSVVGHRRDVVRVTRGKIVRIVRLDQLGEGIGAGGIMFHLPVDRGQSRLGRRVEQKQLGMNRHVFPHPAKFFRGEGRAFGQHDDRNSIRVQMSFGNHDEVAGGVGHSHFMQGLHGNRNHAQCFAGLLKLPAGDGDHPIGLQMLEVFAESFDRVQTVLAQGKGACGGGGPGVHQRHLHDVELLIGIAHKRPAIGDVDVYFRLLIEMECVVRVTAPHDRIGNDGIDLDSSNTGAAIAHRAEDIHAAAGADNGELSAGAQNIGQRRWRRHQISLPRAFPMMGIDIHQVG